MAKDAKMSNPSEASSKVPATAPGTITNAFATPIARLAYPQSPAYNEELAEIILGRLYGMDNQFTYKSETTADMLEWGEPVIDSLTSWVLRMATKFVETVSGKALQDAYTDGIRREMNTRNTRTDEREDTDTVYLAPMKGWASIYSKGSYHPAHFHPNTAIAAIYYVQAPDTCDLDLLDPRPNLDYYDPGIQFADEGRNLRLRCKPGELLLFPGWMKHCVPEFGAEGLRISMSWNLTYALRSESEDRDEG